MALVVSREPPLGAADMMFSMVNALLGRELDEISILGNRSRGVQKKLPTG